VRTRRLGSAGPDITVIGYGAWEAGGDDWGPNDSEATVLEAIRAAVDAGIGWIDTAEVYGDGVSETLVGRAIRGRRDDVLIATKVAPSPEGTGFRPADVRRACEASLRRLGTDRIDLYQLHWPDETGVPLEDTWGAMGELVEAGAVRFVGVSNFDRGQIETCLTIRHVDSLQPEFSILAQDERDVIRWCGEVGVGVISYSPLGAGLLTGAVTADTAIDDWRSDVTEGFLADRASSLAVVDRLRPVADGLGVSLAELALAWNVAQPGVTAAIAGSRNARHVRANARAGDIELDEAALRAVDDALTR
jgi:aryl-alcohol dehydrogenase-like predicted oxidoreductase